MDMNFQIEEILNQLNKHKDILILGGFGSLMILIGFNEWMKSRQPAPLTLETEAFSEDANNDGVFADVVIDVSGAVNNPGVYRFEAGTRTGIAIEAAGGLHVDADPAYVAQSLNLASELRDGSKLYIPFVNETPITNQTMGASQSNNLINLNSATQTELESLTGIGESRAKAIISNRPFANLDELNSKAGVPKSVLEKIKDTVVF